MTDTLERLKCLYSAVNNKKELGFYDMETLDRSIAEITALRQQCAILERELQK